MKILLMFLALLFGLMVIAAIVVVKLMVALDMDDFLAGLEDTDIDPNRGK